MGRELPKAGFVLNKERVTYYDFKMNTPPFSEEYSSVEFYTHHNNFIKAILPDIYLAFIEKQDVKKRFSDRDANLFIQVTNYDPRGDSDITFTYSIDFVNQNFVPKVPKLRAGTYTLLSQEQLFIVTQNTLLQKFLATVVPVAHAQSFENFSDYLF